VDRYGRSHVIAGAIERTMLAAGRLWWQEVGETGRLRSFQERTGRHEGNEDEQWKSARLRKTTRLRAR
jgi:hypothetical protein